MTSAEIGELAKALAAAQSEMTAATKDATNPHFKSKYATLASVWDAIRKPLTANGLSVSQILEAEQGGVAVRTMLLHSSGQWLASRYVMPIGERLTPQAMGSAITYARRYALSAIVGIAPDDDDDGNAATDPPKAEPKGKQAPRPAQPQPEPPPPAKPTLLPALADLFAEFAWPKESKVEFANRLLSHYEVTLADCMASVSTAGGVLNGLQAEIKAIQQAENCDRPTALQTLMARAMEGAR
jgi:hypothetical protein